MRILITGGAGFIGRHIAEHFQDRAEVRVLDNLRGGFKSNLSGLDCQLIVGSILDRDLVREAIKGVDFVFHLAAMMSVQESVQKPNECAEIRLAGKTTLRQVLVLYTRSAILVTNDSGPAHFASMTPIHVVTLFGPETPALFAARSPNAIALWAGIACSPCVNAYNNRQSVCRNNLCMQAITVDDVFKEVTGIYDSVKTTTFGN